MDQQIWFRFAKTVETGLAFWHGVEFAHRPLATRERAPLVPIELFELAGELVAIEAPGIQVALGLPHPHDFDMSRCDPHRMRAAIGACSLTGDHARKLSYRLHKPRL